MLDVGGWFKINWPIKLCKIHWIFLLDRLFRQGKSLVGTLTVQLSYIVNTYLKPKMSIWRQIRISYYLYCGLYERLFNETVLQVELLIVCLISHTSIKCVSSTSCISHQSKELYFGVFWSIGVDCLCLNFYTKLFILKWLKLILWKEVIKLSISEIWQDVLLLQSTYLSKYLVST